jgi:hypothetical protein
MASLQELRDRVDTLERALAHVNLSALTTLTNRVTTLETMLRVMARDTSELLRVVGLPQDTADRNALTNTIVELLIMVDNLASRLEFVMREIRINRTVCGILDLKPRVESLTLWEYYDAKVTEAEASARANGNASANAIAETPANTGESGTQTAPENSNGTSAIAGASGVTG